MAEDYEEIDLDADLDVDLDAIAEFEVLDDEPEQASRWSQLWQVPVLLLGMAVFFLSLYLVWPQPQENQFDEVLQEVRLFLEAREIDQASDLLKTRLGPFIAQGDKLQQATYYLHWGDLIFLQQEVNGWDKAENHHKTLRYYQKARELGLSLSPTQLQRMASTLVALKRDVEAMALLDLLIEAPAQRRYGIVRRIITRRLNAGVGILDLTALFTRFDTELRQETDRQARREQELWSVGVQAQGRLQIGQPEQAVKYLQRRMIHFMDSGGDDDLAPLRILLAKAFQQLGEYEEAQRWFRLAQQKLATTDLLNADVLVGLAQIVLAQTGDVRGALESFSAAEVDYPTAGVYTEALIGRADCEARLGVHTEAIEHFGLATKVVTEEVPRRSDKVDRLVDAIHTHFDLNAGRQDYKLALDYLSLLRPVFRETMPADVLLEFAVIHEQIAKRLLEEFDSEDADEAASGQAMEPPLADSDQSSEFLLLRQRPPPVSASDSGARRLAMQEAAGHFGQAGEHYLLHARSVSGADDDGFGRSLWAAAICFDKAQLWDKAIEVYAEYVKARPDDPRQTEAIHHLGLAYQSDGQYPVAAELFKQLIDEHKHTPEAYKSLVPLARCHIAVGEHDAAERVLSYVVTDHPAIRPDSIQYREALIELGKLYYQVRRFNPAITRLKEAVDRYGQLRQGSELRFRLADAYRLSVAEIEETLKQTLPQRKEADLRAERARRLEQGQRLFDVVISQIESIEKPERSALEQLCLRNAFFYRADCAFDLGKYEQAISLYDLAAKRWEAHPASLVALVQIVNAYSQMGRTQEAKVANDRARWQLQRIPDQAFDDPNLPMTREHWQQWLRWTSELNLFGPQQASTVGAEPNP